MAQLLFKHQADGSITANGSTLIGQNWSKARCPGHLLGSCVFHGRPDDPGPYAADPKKDVSGGDNPLTAKGVSGESGASNLGPGRRCCVTTRRRSSPTGTARGVDPTPDLVTTSGSGYDPDITPADATSRSRWSPGHRHRRRPAARTDRQPDERRQLGFLGSRYIVVLQLNEALATPEVSGWPP